MNRIEEKSNAKTSLMKLQRNGFDFIFWTPMEWEEKIPLGRQDLQD